jgi:hypothetical protein
MAAMVVIAALSGCAGQGMGAGSGDPSAGRSVQAEAGGAYRPVARSCDLLDAEALAGRYGKRLDSVPYQNRMGWRGEQRLDCALAFDGRRGLARVDVVAELFDEPGASRETYEGMRQAQQGTFDVRDLSGIGRRAHSYFETVTGHHLYVYDGNAYLSLGLNMIDDGAAVTGDEARTVLVAQARHALKELTPAAS